MQCQYQADLTHSEADPQASSRPRRVASLVTLRQYERTLKWRQNSFVMSLNTLARQAELLTQAAV